MTTTTLLLLLHPIAAVAMLIWFVRQHRWRKRGRQLTGMERDLGVDAHVRAGNRLFYLAWLVVGIAFGAEAIIATMNGRALRTALPSTLHGALGLVGLGLLTLLWLSGRRAHEMKEAAQPFAAEQRRHGRASDFILALAGLHAFLGFLDLLQRL